MKLDPDLVAKIVAASREDPMTRFVRSLPEQTRAHAEETIRMRTEFLSDVQRMLSCTNPNEAIDYATRVSKNAVEVSLRWTILVYCTNRWAERQCDPLFLVLSPEM